MTDSHLLRCRGCSNAYVATSYAEKERIQDSPCDICGGPIDRVVTGL